jgi:hypothetical protein
MSARRGRAIGRVRKRLSLVRAAAIVFPSIPPFRLNFTLELADSISMSAARTVKLI